MAINRLSQSTAQSAFPKFTNFWDGTTATSSFDSLGSIVVSTATATVTFSSIPQTYTHLQVRWTALTTRTTYGYDAMTFRVGNLNSIDSGSNYTWQVMRSAGASATTGSTGSADSMWYLDWGFGTTVSSYPMSAVIDILDYTNTTKAKSMRGIYGGDTNGAIGGVYGSINLVGGSWFKSGLPAINTMSFTSYNSNNIAPGTVFTLYGVK